MTRRDLLAAAAVPLLAQTPPAVEFLCPMDKDVRTKGPGQCPRCGMRLTANLPAHREFRLDLRTRPAGVRAGQPAELELTVRDPDSGAAVRDFEVIHEKIFHLFIVSQDLSYFAHEHPEQLGSGAFRHRVTLPSAGAYRVVADCYPRGATIQFLARTLITADAPLNRLSTAARLSPSMGVQRGANLAVRLKTEPAEPLAGKETLMFFDLDPADGLEQYLGAWGHMLVASADLIDLVHDHPLYADGGARVQFNLIFPRAGVHRVWVQFQRRGVVNTAAFDVPVKTLA